MRNARCKGSRKHLSLLAPMEGGRVQAYDAGEQVRKEPLALSQERAFALYTAKLLQKRESQNLRIREFLERLVARASRVDASVCVVGETEKHDHGIFRSGETWGRVSEGHLLLLVEGSRMAPVVPSIHATDI